MQPIPLTKGYFAVVDDEDFERVNKFKWHAAVKKRDDGSIYAVYAILGRAPTAVALHRFVLHVVDPNIEVDHKDDNGMYHGLDNRKQNLRICTHAENSRNARKTVRVTSSKLKGVSWESRHKKWESRIAGRRIGYFSNEVEAAHAYDAAALQHFGAFAKTNFKGKLCTL